MSKAIEIKILDKAKSNYLVMQKSWWDFAKIIHEIKETESYKLAKYETFKDYCESEFPSTNYDSIKKFVTVVTMMGKSIESKFEKDKTYTLPSYETCYAISTMKEGSMTKEEMARLKRDVLERKLSYHKLRDRIKDMLEAKRKETKEFVKKSVDEIGKLEKQLEEEIDMADEDAEINMSSSDDEFDDLDSVEIGEDLVESDYQRTLDEYFDLALKSSGELYDTLELVEENIKGVKFDKKIEKFANKVNKTYQKLDTVLGTIEGMQS